jgi:DNA-directed RNA polymerase specialized sigma24 family protein
MKKVLSETALIGAIKKRSRTGAENLYDRYAKTLFKVICCSVNNPAYAELTLEQTMDTIWNNIDDFNSKEGSFLLWMAGIAKARSKQMQNLSC